MKITNQHKLFYANKKLKMNNDISIHSLINDQVRERNAFLNDMHNAYKIIASNYKRLSYEKFIHKLQWYSVNASTRQLQLASKRLLKGLKVK